VRIVRFTSKSKGRDLGREAEVADNAEEARARAEARFQKEQKKAQESEQSRLDQVAAANAIDVKGARLRAFRLAKEADDAQAAAAAEKHPTKAKKSRLND
jgi:hypothetical protein